VLKQDVYPSAEWGVLDLGMNRGYFTLLFGELGYHTVSVEPQMDCIKHARLAIDANKLTPTLRILNEFVSEKEHATAAPVFGCSTAFGDKNLGKRSTQYESARERILVRPLHSILKDHLLPLRKLAFVKMDTEGSEAAALLGLGLDGLRYWSVQNLVVELAPHVWARAPRQKERMWRLLEKLQLEAKRVYALDEKQIASVGGRGERCGLVKIQHAHFGEMWSVTDISVYIGSKCAGNIWVELGSTRPRRTS